MNDAYKPCSQPTNQPNYDEEVAEVLWMKNECNRMAHELIEQIDALLARIDYILSRNQNLCQNGYGKNLSIEDREFLMRGNQKFEA